MDLSATFRALGNERRIQILAWLRDPEAHFPAQIDGDLVADGVCGVRLAEKLGITQSTLSEHMRLLVGSGLVVPTRIRQWTFYRRDPGRVAEIANALSTEI